MKGLLDIRNRIKIPSFTAGIFCAVIFAADAALAAGGDHGAEQAQGGGHGAEKSAGLPQFDPSTYPSQIFWLAVTFVVLYVFFSSRILPDISSVLENRRNHITSDLETAEKLKTEADHSQKTFEADLGRARSEAAEVMAEMQERVRALEARENATFASKTENEIKALESRLQKAKLEVMDEMNTIAAELAREAAEKIVGISTDLKQAKNVVMALNNKEAA